MNPRRRRNRFSGVFLQGVFIQNTNNFFFLYIPSLDYNFM
jgi:hypothetical protein